MSNDIRIPNLCNEDWNKMTPNDNGRFCDTCKLTVVDFTKMSDGQIKNYLLNKGYVCGRFDCTQIDISHQSTLELLHKKAKKINLKPLRWLALLLLFIPVIIFSCRSGFSLRPKKLMGAVQMPSPRHFKK
jgi:hypothetical protein